MGAVTAAAFSLGVLYGFGSYQASVGQGGLASQAIGPSAAPYVKILRDSGLIKSNTLPGLTVPSITPRKAASDYMVDSRNQMADILRNSGHPNATDEANVFQLGVLTGLAEAQASGPSDQWNNAVGYAHSALVDAKDITVRFVNPFNNNKLRVGELDRALGHTVNFESSTSQDVHVEMQQLNTDFHNDMQATSQTP